MIYVSSKRILFAFLAIGVIAAVGYFVWPKAPSIPQPIACTQEAKLCEDGSAVGRTGPSCEFAACPEEKGPDPNILLTKYIAGHEWPPKIAISNDAFSCPDPGIMRAVDSRTYCVQSTTGAAAGSTYTEYVYSTVKNGKLVTLRFTLRYPQCMNYDVPEQTECKNEREAFDLDGTIDRIAQRVTVN